MSEVRARFVVPPQCAPTACCDSESTRFALGSALVTPAENGVFVAACDSRVLSIVKLEGETDKPHFIPQNAVGKGKKATRKTPATEAVLNGRWECDGKFVPHDDAIGRAPNLPAVLPEFSPLQEELVAVSFNPALLAKLVDAVGCENNGNAQHVTLLMRRKTEVSDTDHDQREVSGAIGVIGANGIGVLMPCMITDRKSGESVNGEIARFAAFREEYSKTFGQPSA